jgi:hypothetical protein
MKMKKLLLKTNINPLMFLALEPLPPILYCGNNEEEKEKRKI